MNKDKSIIIAARWVAKGDPFKPGDLVASRKIGTRELRIRVIEFDGDVEQAMDAAHACCDYRDKVPLLEINETLLNTIPVPA